VACMFGSLTEMEIDLRDREQDTDKSIERRKEQRNQILVVAATLLCLADEPCDLEQGRKRDLCYTFDLREIIAFALAHVA
jgi:hypothetical protein